MAVSNARIESRTSAIVIASLPIGSDAGEHEVMSVPAIPTLRNGLCLARRLWVMGGIRIEFEHRRDDGTSD
jgi:hypothetical protein